MHILKYNFFTFPRLFLTCGALLLVGACGTTSTDLAAVTIEEPDVVKIKDSGEDLSIESVQNDENPFDTPPEEIVYGHFTQDILARVIVAEIAGQRGLNDQALDEYLILARETGDLGIIIRASSIAAFMRDPRATTEMTKLWLEQEPESIEAYQILVIHMLEMSRYRDAIDALETLLEMDHVMDFRVIPNRLEVDQDASLYRESLIADFLDLVERHPDDPSVRLALAQLYDQNEQHQEAYELVIALSDEMYNPPELIMLEVELLQKLGNRDAALNQLSKGVLIHPEHLELRFQYGRTLVTHQNYEEASTQFSIIVEQNPDDYDMLYSLALINLEINHLREAQNHLEELVRVSHRPDDTHYYLGFIHNQYSEDDLAIEHYMRVDNGTNFMNAQNDLTKLLIQADRYPEAKQRLQRLRYTQPDYNLPLLALEAGVLMDEGYLDEASTLLNSSLIVYPDNMQFLYLRSLLSTNRNELALMERDLRRMITLDPGNPTPYNSLGYFLADRTERIDEAYELIMKAAELAPDDPAIIDSLGWVQYRLGLFEDARRNLETAFRLFPDHEVAAHLGEVMWMMGDHQAADQLWQDALEQQPDSAFILETMQRLKTDS